MIIKLFFRLLLLKITFFMNRYFFNVSTSPERELCFIVVAVGMFSLIVTFITVDILFCGLCLYIVAMYKELQRMLECIDRKSNDLELLTDKDQYNRRRLIDCIESHWVIIR